MAPSILADQIREFTYAEYVRPMLARAQIASIRAGDIHRALKFKQRVPAICEALKANKFEDEFGLVLLRVEGPPVGATTTFFFAAAEDESASGRRPPLTEAHISALEWFREQAGQIVSWSDLSGSELRKAAAPKGIYRPATWRHALSIKIIPDGPYPDELPDAYEAGLTFRYHQEEVSGQDPARERSNLGLANCMRDRVPVGIVRRTRPKPNPQYEIVGVGAVVEWREGFFAIRLLGSGDDVGETTPADGPPASDDDARRRVSRSIVARRGQSKFRKELFQAYGGRCVISGCDVAEVLEAAHIRPYLGDHTDVVPNGLLLRADLHTLFDLGLIRIEPTTRTVLLADALLASEYQELHERVLRPPARTGDQPSSDFLEHAWLASATALLDPLE